MKHSVNSSIDDSAWKTYTVSVNFATFIGADEEYTIEATDEDSAIAEALDMAKGDLSVDDITQTDDSEYEVEVGFAGFIGVTETYTVYADDEDEASDLALQEAEDDLEAEIVDEEDEDYDEEEEEE